jgi:hypothetical protein
MEADQKENESFIELELPSDSSQIHFSKEPIGNRDVNLSDLMGVSMISTDPKQRKEKF